MARAPSFPTLLPALLAALTLAACAAEDGGDRPDERVYPGDDKGDGRGVDLRDRLVAGAPVTARLGTGTRIGYVLFAGEGATLDVEVTRAGSTAGLDTDLVIHGPRAADGGYPSTLVEDADDGFGALSRIRGFTPPATGHYLVEVRLASGSKAGDARVALTCQRGACDGFQPVPGHRDHTRWTDSSAEWQALAHQAYATATARLEARAAAGLPAAWAVVVDVDETTLSNVTYEQERAAIGAGFSAAAWTAWVERRAATPIPGAAAYLRRVHELGGAVIGVTNRKVERECAPTRDNLAAEGLAVDHLLCKADTSDKNPRFAAIEDGSALDGVPPLAIVQFVGDNIQDFPGLDQALRGEPDEAFADFGDRFVVLPNPLYGSWTRNP